MKMSPNNAAESIELWGPFRCSVASSEGFMQEAYCCVAENLESSSYPGLLRQFVWRVFLQKTGFRWACIHRGSMECTFVDWSVCRNNMEEFSNGRVNVIKHQVSFTVYIGSRHRFALCLHHALLRGATFGQRPTFLWGIGSEAVKPWHFLRSFCVAGDWDVGATIWYQRRGWQGWKNHAGCNWYLNMSGKPGGNPKIWWFIIPISPLKLPYTCRYLRLFWPQMWDLTRCIIRIFRIICIIPSSGSLLVCDVAIIYHCRSTFGTTNFGTRMMKGCNINDGISWEIHGISWDMVGARMGCNGISWF